jgi:hypothetical protein
MREQRGGHGETNGGLGLPVPDEFVIGGRNRSGALMGNHEGLVAHLGGRREGKWRGGIVE